MCFSLISALQPTIVPSASALPSSSQTIASQGSIEYGGGPVDPADLGVTLKYGTDFENIIKTDSNTLSMPISHRFNLGGDNSGASSWMEGLDRNSGIQAHSGLRCVGMDLTADDSDARCEFNIVGLNSLVGSKLFVSVWLYLPADWGLFDPGWNWYEISNPMTEGSATYLPYWAIHIVKPPSFRIDIDMRGLDGQIVTLAETPLGSAVLDLPLYPLPRGRWFNLQYYVLRSSGSGVADGAVKVWIDGRTVCDLNGVVTSGGDDWYTCPAKIYGSLVQSAMPYKLWVDDLSIYGAP